MKVSKKYSRLVCNLNELVYNEISDYKYAPVAKEYARRTMAFGGFNRPSPSGSDLYQTLFTLKRGDALFGKERDAMLMDKVRIPRNLKLKDF